MPSIWRIRLGDLDASEVSLTAVHAVVSRWLDTHHHAQLKPHSVTPLRRDGQGTSLEVGLLDDTVAKRLRDHVWAGARVRFNRQQTVVSAPPELVVAEDWDMLTADSGASAWSLRFLTPTTFRHGNRYSPWPDPLTVVTGLHRRLLEFASWMPALPQLRRDQLWVSDVAGTSEVFKLDRRTVSGFVGRVRFEAVSDIPGRAVIDAAVRMSRYAGVGAHTTHGLGVTRLDPTWQPSAT